MMSTGKAMGCLCVLKLVDEGKIGLNAPLAKYSAEFAQAGKDAITVRQVLSHLAGLVFLDPGARQHIRLRCPARCCRASIRTMATGHTAGLPHVHHRDSQPRTGLSGHGLGFLLSGGALEFTGTPDTFAGLGAGGYVGVEVPSCRLGFACVGNRMAHALDEGPLSKTLMSAMMSCF